MMPSCHGSRDSRLIRFSTHTHNRQILQRLLFLTFILWVDRRTLLRRRTALFGPFLLIFVDFHHSTATSIFSHSNLLKMSQIPKCYTSSSFCPIKILINMIDSKFQRKQNILLRFSIFAIKKDITFCVNHHSIFMVIEYTSSTDFIFC